MRVGSNGDDGRDPLRPLSEEQSRDHSAERAASRSSSEDGAGERDPWRVLGLLIVGAILLFGVVRAVDFLRQDEPDAPAPRPAAEPAPAEPDASAEPDAQADPQEDPYAFQYQISYGQCSDSENADDIYAQAGTSDPYEAAEWLGEGLVDGPHRAGATAGCYDALIDDSPRY